YGDTRLVSVKPDEIVTEDGAGQHHIPRAEPGETRVAWVKNMPNNALPMAGGVGQPGINPNGMSPEVRQRMIERGIDPNNRFQQRMNGRGGRGGGGPGGGGNFRGGGGGPGGGGGGPTDATSMSGDIMPSQATTVKSVGPNGETILKVTDSSGAVKTMRV